MPEEIEVDTDKLHEAIADEFEREGGNLLRTVALSTAIFAALAAITSLQAGSTANEALILKTEATVLQAKASDAWAYYQAKGIKAAIAHNAQGVWSAADKTPPAELAEEEARYLKEQHDIDTQAREFEKERDAKSTEAGHLMHQHHRYAEAVALLQVGIALGAVAALTRKRPAWFASVALGLSGCALFAYALFSAH